MKLLFDENLSPHLPSLVQDVFPDLNHVEDCGLLSAPDDKVWRFALENGFSIVTKDSDFSERSVLDGCPPKIVWLRIGNCSTIRAAQALRNHSFEIANFLASAPECCLVISVSPQQIAPVRT